MVRTDTNQNEPSEDKKETTSKRRSAPRKKTVITGVWPCKINGCNKQFAREADLKRHQRTTKLHSMPSLHLSACPQCDANFTRTDALRRHQKSRHNGVVIEPPEKDEAEDDGSSGSQSKSRSATPSSKGKEKAQHPAPPPAPYSAPTATRSGPSSYYRQHTLTTSPYVPRQLVMDPNYAQVALPTSATRLSMATHWGYPHPWPDGTSPQQMSYQQMYYATHYRPNGTAPVQGSIPPTAQNPTPNIAEGTNPASCPPQDTKQPNIDNRSNNLSLPIDPSLDAHESTELTAEQIMQITKALLEDQRDRSSSAGSETDQGTLSSVQDTNNGIGLSSEGKGHTLHAYGLPLVRPEPMEHMLTEDGEPMLNPAELLTQESLASPPPS